MTVDGAHNISRIPGLHVYAVRSYDTTPVESVPQVRERNSSVSFHIPDQGLQTYSRAGIQKGTEGASTFVRYA